MPNEENTSEREKDKGRPSRKYPPRIDATPEEIVRVVLSGRLQKGPVKDLDYRCDVCEREVNYPETLYNDGMCLECHAAALA